MRTFFASLILQQILCIYVAIINMAAYKKYIKQGVITRLCDVPRQDIDLRNNYTTGHFFQSDSMYFKLSPFMREHSNGHWIPKG